MAVNSIFDLSLEDGDIVVDDGLKPDDVVNASDDALERIEAEKELEKDMISLENNFNAYAKLEEQEVKNEYALEDDNNDGIADEDIIISQETLITTLSTLGYSRKDIRALSISSEARVDKRQALAISNEGIIDSIKQIVAGILNLFKSIFKKIREYVAKFINWLFNRKSLIEKMIIYAKQHSDDELPGLAPNYTKKIADMNAIYLEVNNGVLDIKKVIDFYTNLNKDPISEHMNELLNILTGDVSNINDQIVNFKNKINQEADKNQMHKEIKNYLAKSDDNVLYLVGVTGSKVWGYVDTKDSGLGIGLKKLKPNVTANFKEIKGVKKVGDFVPLLNDILSAVNNTSSFGKQVENTIKLAEKTVKDFEKKITGKDIQSDIQRKTTMSTLGIIKETGSRTLMIFVNNYAENTLNLTKTISYYLAPLMKLKNKELKENK